MLNAAGYEPYLYEDFTDEAFSLFREIANAVQAGNADSVLHENFNDETIQNCFITYLRVRSPVACDSQNPVTNRCSDTHLRVDEDATGRLCTMVARTDRRQLLRGACDAYEQ